MSGQAISVQAGSAPSSEGGEKQHREKQSRREQKHQLTEIVKCHGLGWRHPTLSSVSLVFRKKTAKKHQEQAQADEGETEGGQKTHADEQCFQG